MASNFPNMSFRRSLQKGFSLIELMIAMLLGLLVVAAAGSYGGDLMGLISRVKGSRDPVVYVPGIVSGAAGGVSLVGRLAGFYGRIVAEEQVRTLTAGTFAAPALSLGVVEIEAEL